MKTIHSPLLLVSLVIIFLTTSSSSCQKEDKTPAPDLSKGYPENFTNKVSSKQLNKIKERGGKINEGQDPPPLEGVFKATEVVVGASDSKRVGDRLDGETYYKFSNYNPKTKECSIEWIQIDKGKVIQTSFGGGNFAMAGHSNKFTLVGKEVLTDSDGSVHFKQSSYVGELTPNGIIDWEFGLFEVDIKDNDLGIWAIFWADPNLMPRASALPGGTTFPGRIGIDPNAEADGKTSSSIGQLLLNRH